MFLEKGYDKDFLYKEWAKIKNIYREKLIKNKETHENEKMQYTVVIDCNIQHKVVEKIINRHWDILKQDTHIGSSLPNLPSYFTKKSLNMVVKNIVHLPTNGKPMFWYMKGFYGCGR